MTPQDALEKALERAYRNAGMNRAADLGAQHEEARLVLAALAADGWTVARTQDARDGEALRLLREALPEGFDCEVTFMQGDVWEVSVYDGPDVVAQFTEATIAAAADACREAIEATR